MIKMDKWNKLKKDVKEMIRFCETRDGRLMHPFTWEARQEEWTDVLMSMEYYEREEKK